MFYHFVLPGRPVSFDWNLNLYASAEAGDLLRSPDVRSGPERRSGLGRDVHIERGWLGLDVQHPPRQHRAGPTDRTAGHGARLRLLLGAPAQPGQRRGRTPASSSTSRTPRRSTSGEEGDRSPRDLGLKALDDWTLEVTLEGPRAYFPQMVAYNAACPRRSGRSRSTVPTSGRSGDMPLVVATVPSSSTSGSTTSTSRSPRTTTGTRRTSASRRSIDPIIPAESVLAFEQGEGDQRLDWVNVPRRRPDRASRRTRSSREQLQQYVYPGIWMLLPSNGLAPFENDEVGLRCARR